ncbi:MAG: RNA polymerase sigma factor [Bacillota bacterium]
MPRKALPPLVPEQEPPGLSEQQRMIYRLAREGKTVRDIIETIDTTELVVRTQLRRIREAALNDPSGGNSTTGLEAPLDALTEEELAHLSGRQREVLLLKRTGHKSADIGGILGISAATARSYVRDARRRALEGPTDPKASRSYKVDDLSPDDMRRLIQGTSPEGVDRGTTSYIYKSVIEGSLAADLQALHRAGLRNHATTKAVLTDRARTIKVLALNSRRRLVRIDSPAVRLLLKDVLTEYFRQVAPGLYVEVRPDAIDQILVPEYNARKHELSPNQDGAEPELLASSVEDSAS